MGTTCCSGQMEDPTHQGWALHPVWLPGTGGRRESELPEVSPRVYLIYRFPKLGWATPESPKELVESSDSEDPRAADVKLGYPLASAGKPLKNKMGGMDGSAG